jgi:plasmid rolling circle replication initiator protein Rep
MRILRFGKNYKKGGVLMSPKKDKTVNDLPLVNGLENQCDFELYNDYSTNFEKIQDELKEKFSDKKEQSEKLGRVYKYIGEDKRSSKVLECGSFLEFKVTSTEHKLYRANFCKDRLCPMCNWRRSLKIFSQVSAVMDEMKDYEFIFLTFTVRNCEGVDLSKTVQAIYDGWRYLYNKNSIFRKAIKGTFRSLEVTRNHKTGTFHPHLHCIMAVKKSYFKSKAYINHRTWIDLWRKACNLDYDPWVYVRKVKRIGKGIAGAVAEVAKYSVKSVDYGSSGENVRTFLNALVSRRLCGWTGLFAEIRRKLKLDDAEDGDLVHTETDNLRADIAYMIVRYQWRSGVYNQIDVKIE